MTASIGTPRACTECGKVKCYSDRQFALIRKPYRCRPCVSAANSRLARAKAQKLQG